jgi:S-DNA-T family DNA segregation ATPase FtsK/SpoIIIE
MARKDASRSRPAGNHPVIGIVLGVAGLLLLCALLSYDPRDLTETTTATNNPLNNWVGTVGAHVGHVLFWLMGVTSYLVPVLLLLFALGCLVGFLGYLPRRWGWGIVLLVCCTGFVSTFEQNIPGMMSYVKHMNFPDAGGLVGQSFYDHGLVYTGKVGGSIVLAGLYLISLLYLTNFRLGEWCRQWWMLRSGAAVASVPAVNQGDLEKRARTLEKQARQLQDQLDKSANKAGGPATPSGLGADMQPVPEPTVRDLSVPQPSAPQPARKPKEPETPKEPAPAEEGEVIPAREVAAATTADILGKSAAADSSVKDGATEKPVTPTSESPAAAAVPEEGGASVVPIRPKPAPRKPKQIAVAATPHRQLRIAAAGFPATPDTTLKPTESKEELMANARLMQQTLAQFDIEVALGDITKGPTITRYELHPAPGVKLEKIVGLSNNIAAALKAERINILAPVPGKSSVGVEVPNLVKTKVIMRDLFESDEWRATKARIPLALGKDVYGVPIVADLAEMPHLAHRRQHRFGQVRLHQRHHRLAALPVSPGPIAVRHD